MKVETYIQPKSSFLSMEKDLAIIVNTALKNENLKKLLHYNNKTPLNMPKLSEEESLNLFGRNIKIVPKLTIDGSVLNYIIVSFDNFTENATNPEFRDNIVEFDIICHIDQWQLTDFQLRPYRIAAEIDSMFNKRHLTGIGTLQFLGGSQIVLSNEYIGICLMYEAIHGEEDRKFMPNPNNEEQFIENFNNIFNDD